MSAEHPSVESLEALVAGEADPSVEAHVGQCGQCSALLDELRDNLSLEAELSGVRATVVHRVPESIDGYRVLREIGRGGMGVVYAAEQENPSRRVALKVVLGAAYADEARSELFEREIRTLARLSHPGIAAIYDAGSTEDGLRYYTMELVDGQRIDRYVVDQGLDLRARLDLFVPVCLAVQYAHQRGIIHRDLKPSNLLVDPSGRPRVLDFGLARHVASGETASQGTEPGRVQGTLPYMSPEQLGGELGDVDTRSDVYSLGVVLYQLLTGGLPHDVSDTTPLAAARIICERSVPRPRGLPRDLEVVLMKSLAKEKSQRYSSPEAFADDLTRFLRGRPVLARPASWTYAAGKWIGRHQLASGLATALVLVAVGFVAWLQHAYTLVSDERDRAADEAEDRRRVNRFTQDMIGATGWRQFGRQLSLEEQVDQAVARLDAGAVTDPGSEAELRFTLGHAYGGQGRWDKARPQLVRARALFEAMDEVDPDLRGNVIRDLAVCAKHQREYDEALDLLDELPADDWRAALTRADVAHERGDYAGSLAVLEGIGALPPEDAWRLDYEKGIVLTEMGRFPEALEVLERSLAAREALGHLEHRTYTVIQGTLATVYREVGRVDDSLALLEECYATELRLLGDGPDAATTRGRIAHLEVTRGNLPEALEHYEAIDVTLTRSYPQGHVKLASNHLNLGEVLMQLGRLDDASTWIEKGIELRRALLEEGHPDIGAALGIRGSLEVRRGDYDAAGQWLQRAADVLRENPEHSMRPVVLANLGAVSAMRGETEVAYRAFQESEEVLREAGSVENLASVLLNLGTMARELGEMGEAEEAWREAESIFLDLGGEEHPRVAQARSFLAGLALDGDDTDAARALLEQAWPAATRSSDQHPIAAGLRVERGRLARASDEPEAAGAEFDAALAVYRARFPRGHVRIAKTLVLRAELRAAAGRTDEARADLTEALALFERLYVADHPRTLAARERLMSLD